MAAIAKLLAALVIHGRLVEVEVVVGRWLRGVVARMGARMSAGVGARVRKVAAHQAIMIIVAGRLIHVMRWPVVHVALGLGLLVGPDEDRVVSMRLDMLLQVLRPLEGLSTKLTLVRFQRNVNTDVRGDVVTLDGGCPAGVPLAGEVQVVGALAANMALTDVLLRSHSQRSERHALGN